MPRESAVLEAGRRLRGARHSRGPLQALPRPPLRVVDVALFYGERSGGIRTYIDAKAAWAKATGVIDHHVIVPGRAERHEDGRHELPSLRLAATNGYRLPVGARALRATLRDLEPGVVVLHDPFWRPLRVTQTAHELGARVVAAHHGSIALDAAGLPGPDGLWHPLLRTWMHQAYADADAVMSAVDPLPDCGRPTTIALRFGVHPAFVPQPHVRRQDHVLYVGRLGREKGVVELLHAAARSAEPWQLKLVGRGPIEQRLRRLARRLGIEQRVRRGRAARALLGRAPRPVLRSRRPGRAPGGDLDVVVAGAARARRPARGRAPQARRGAPARRAPLRRALRDPVGEHGRADVQPALGSLSLLARAVVSTRPGCSSGRCARWATSSTPITWSRRWRARRRATGCASTTTRSPARASARAGSAGRRCWPSSSAGRLADGQRSSFSATSITR